MEVSNECKAVKLTAQSSSKHPEKGKEHSAQACTLYTHLTLGCPYELYKPNIMQARDRYL